MQGKKKEKAREEKRREAEREEEKARKERSWFLNNFSLSLFLQAGLAIAHLGSSSLLAKLENRLVYELPA